MTAELNKWTNEMKNLTKEDLSALYFSYTQRCKGTKSKERQMLKTKIKILKQIYDSKVDIFDHSKYREPSTEDIDRKRLLVHDERKGE